jgi:hypothetical protein
MSTEQPAPAGRPLDLLQVLRHTAVTVTPSLRHTEIVDRRGLLGLLQHGEPDDGRVLVLCGGAFGGLLGPAEGLYHHLGSVLAEVGVCTIRVDYRIPGHLSSCILDVAVAMDLAYRDGGSRFVVVGHSFGGAVAIGSAVNLPELVVGVATLATQSAGCERAALLGSRPLLLIHGSDDDIVPVGASETVRAFAGTGEVVVLPGADHMLTTAAEELRGRLSLWILRAFDGEAEPF